MIWSNCSTASLPFLALYTIAPSLWSINSITSILISLSSTTSIDRFSMDIVWFFKDLFSTGFKSISKGSWTINWVPSSILLSTLIVPSIFFTSSCTILIPKPAPSIRVFFWTKGLNNLFWMNSSLIPIPVSSTTNSKQSAFSLTDKYTLPFGLLYLIALLKRFNKTFSICVGLPIKWSCSIWVFINNSIL